MGAFSHASGSVKAGRFLDVKRRALRAFLPVCRAIRADLAASLPAWRAVSGWYIGRAQAQAFARRIKTFFCMVRAQARWGPRARFPVRRSSVAHFGGFCRALGKIGMRGEDRRAHWGTIGAVWAHVSCFAAFPIRPEASALPTSQFEPRIDTDSRAGPPLDCLRQQLKKLSAFRRSRYQKQPKSRKPYGPLREKLTSPPVIPRGLFCTLDSNVTLLIMPETGLSSSSPD